MLKKIRASLGLRRWGAVASINDTSIVELEKYLAVQKDP